MGAIENGFLRPDMKQFAYTTPSRHEILSACRLRGAYMSDRDSAGPRMGTSPAAFFGNVCHAVLEAAAREDLRDDEDSDLLFDRLWKAKLSEQLTHMGDLRSDRADPAKWPGYAIKKVKTRRLMKELISKRQSEPELVLEPEEDLSAANGELRGRPDLIVRHGVSLAIEDYKTGSLHENDEAGAERVKAAYRRQMLLYAALCNAKYAEWPATAALVSLEGSREEILVDSEEAQELVESALSTLHGYNSSCDSGTDPRLIASPSPAACRFCPFAVVCPAFWGSVTEEWAPAGVLAVSGRLSSVFLSRFGTLELDIEPQGGSCGDQKVSVHALHPSSFSAYNELREGDHVRLSGLRSSRGTLSGSANSRGFTVPG